MLARQRRVYAASIYIDYIILTSIFTNISVWYVQKRIIYMKFELVCYSGIEYHHIRNVHSLHG